MECSANSGKLVEWGTVMPEADGSALYAQRGRCYLVLGLFSSPASQANLIFHHVTVIDGTVGLRNKPNRRPMPTSARDAVRQLQAMGVDSIKIHSIAFPPVVLKTLTEEARSAGVDDRVNVQCHNDKNLRDSADGAADTVWSRA